MEQSVQFSMVQIFNELLAIYINKLESHIHDLAPQQFRISKFQFFWQSTSVVSVWYKSQN